jgi:hypothetical protein
MNIEDVLNNLSRKTPKFDDEEVKEDIQIKLSIQEVLDELTNELTKYLKGIYGSEEE